MQQGAWAAFFSKGVRRTSGATGILVYISQLERRAEVVADCSTSDPVLGFDSDDENQHQRQQRPMQHRK